MEWLHILKCNPKCSGYIVTMPTLVVALLTCNPKWSGYILKCVIRNEVVTVEKVSFCALDPKPHTLLNFSKGRNI